MARDGILYIDFRLLILLICWFCKEMLGGSTAESRLAFPSEKGAVMLGSILVQAKKYIRTWCQSLSAKSLEKSYLKIIFGIFILLSKSAFYGQPQNGI